MSGPEPEAGFLARWSRRKREAAVEPELPAADPQPDPPPEADAAAAAEPQAAQPACPIPNLPAIDPASLPPIEGLTAESDFSLFLRPGVPAGLRNAALRRMWSLDPAIRDYIGPVEYQWDFNAPGGLPVGFANELLGDVKTLLAQAIGEVPARQAGEDAATAEAPPARTPAPEPEAPATPVQALPGPDTTAEARGERAPAAPEAEPVATPAPRRRHGSALPG